MVREEVELCGNCGHENIFQWDVEADGYEAFCMKCGAPMLLCDACMHSDDNPYQSCTTDICKTRSRKNE